MALWRVVVGDGRVDALCDGVVVRYVGEGDVHGILAANTGRVDLVVAE